MTEMEELIAKMQRDVVDVLHGRTCSKCGLFKVESEFTRLRNGRLSWCKLCKASYDKVYRSQHKDKIRVLQRRWEHSNRDRLNEQKRKNWAGLRNEAIQAYGGKCTCCGEATSEFLAIDHIEGHGREHRESINNKLYAWLKRNGYPTGFRVLCHNCNCARGFYGRCPHQA